VNIINTLTLRSLKLNRKRTIVTIIGIILSTAMICGTITLSASFQDLFVQIAIKTDGNFHATFYGLKLDETKYITDNPYTKKAVLSRNLGYALFEQSTSENKPYFFVKEYDAAAFRQMPVQLTAGRFPEKAGEVLISEEIPKRGGKAYQIGETIAFNLGERINERGSSCPMIFHLKKQRSL
jgi:putative ABC transport system permease protein